MLGLVGLSCSEGVGSAPPVPDQQSPVVVAPLEGDRVTPGALLALTFEPGTGRGSHLSLMRWDGGDWAFAYHLSSSRDDPAHATWEPPEGRVASRLLAWGGAGPDFVRVPEPAPQGWYQVCIDFPPDGAPCTAPFEVVAGD